MFDRLKSEIPSFQARLAETISWCVAQQIEANPTESDEIQERRAVAAEAAHLSRRAFVSKGPEVWKNILHRRARALWSKARLHEIKPLIYQLRSAALTPDHLPFKRANGEIASTIDGVVSRRAERLKVEHRYPTHLTNSLQGGRLLLYAPHVNLCDGAAQYSSKGFFDVDNIPPWDTWVCFYEPYLVSWVPPQLIDLANQGIDANPEQCIFWAENLRTQQQ